MLAGKSIPIICMLYLGVRSFIFLHDSMKLSSLNGICPCPCPVSVSYAYKLYPFAKFEISILIPSSFDGFLESGLSMYFTGCIQPIV